MAKDLAVDHLSRITKNPNNIRNITVIAHVDHGKSTLTDSLVSKAGIIAEKLAGDKRFTDTRQDEKDRCITIKSTGVSMYFPCDLDDGKGSQEFLINLIDSPGHIDFSSEVTAALRVTDGALVVVDAVDGVCVQTETVLRQALTERVVPILHLNKIDKAISTLQKDPEDIYMDCRQIIEQVNVIISSYAESGIGRSEVQPDKGTVSFGSGLYGWAFTLETFAKQYAAKYNMPRDKFMKRLWGDYFFDPKVNKWFTTNQAGRRRGFCMYVMDPIVQLFRCILSDDRPLLEKMLKSMGITLKQDDEDLREKSLLKSIFQKWLHAGDVLLRMITTHLPSPLAAQKYRAEILYTGPMDDRAANGIRNCDPNGPLMIYVSKMVPGAEKGRFFAFGRIFSGTARPGTAIRVQGPKYEKGSKVDLFTNKPIQKTFLFIGKSIAELDEIPAGNTIGIAGIDQFIVKTGTLTDWDDAFNFTDMKYSVSPVVRVAVKPKDPSQLSKLIAGLDKLVKADSLVQYTKEESGELILAGCGELHIDVCVKDLESDFANMAIVVSPPVVQYKETVSDRSFLTCVSKSSNKHNRLYMEAEPLNEDLSNDIDSNVISAKQELKERSNMLVDKYDWEKNHALKIWFFGPNYGGPNVFVDQTSSVQYLHEIKEHCCSGFQIVTAEGPICGEQLRGIRFNLLDVKLHADAIHRGGPQIISTCKRVLAACVLSAKPVLQEPIYEISITVPQESLSGVYSVLNTRRGHIFSETQKAGMGIVELKGFLPVAESFGFVESLRAHTGGKAFAQCYLHHWETLTGDAYCEGSKLSNIILEKRRQKGLEPLQLPTYEYYYDKV